MATDVGGPVETCRYGRPPRSEERSAAINPRMVFSIGSRTSQSSHEQPVLPLDRHVELLDCEAVRFALVGSLYRAEALHLFAAKNDNRPSARRARWLGLRGCHGSN